MYPTEKMGNFQPAMLVYQRVDFLEVVQLVGVFFIGGVTKSKSLFFFPLFAETRGMEK